MYLGWWEIFQCWLVGLGVEVTIWSHGFSLAQKTTNSLTLSRTFFAFSLFFSLLQVLWGVGWRSAEGWAFGGGRKACFRMAHENSGDWVFFPDRYDKICSNSTLPCTCINLYTLYSRLVAQQTLLLLTLHIKKHISRKADTGSNYFKLLKQLSFE